ncbi:MAG: hypothetical protein ACJA1C_000882 [Crocinitomicaceae bacterium]|jgi:hypothetical protein
MKFLLTVFTLTILLFSCAQEVNVTSKEKVKNEISDQEKHVSKLSMDPEKTKETVLAKGDLVDVLLSFYQKYPKDDYSANCLSKVVMLYTGLDDVDMATAYADTLIDKYPKFVDRSQIIEIQIVAYEISITPRDTDKIKKYLNLWLKENTKASKEKISEMKYHLENVETPLIDRFGENMVDLK